MGNTASWFEGPQGPRGYTGSNGAQGIQGIQGPRGSNGDRGPPGSNGDKGPPGSNGIQGPPGTNGRDGRDGRNGRDGISSLPIPLGTETVTLKVNSAGASVYDNTTVRFTGQNQIVYSEEQYNSSANNTYLQFNIPVMNDILSANLSDNIIAGLTNNINNLVYAFRFTYNSDNSTNYTIFNNNSLTATYSTPTTFSIYIINNQLTYLVNGLVFYSETINPTMSLKLYMTGNTRPGLTTLSNIKFYQVARITSSVFSRNDFMEQAEAPLMGLLASVGVNSATYTTYFNNPTNSNIKIALLNDVSNWQTSNAPLTMEKVTKFNHYYTCWIEANTPLITTTLPFSCANYYVSSAAAPAPAPAPVPEPYEEFRNYTFKGALPTSRLLERDYHSYD